MHLLMHRARLAGHNLVLPKTVDSQHKVGDAHMGRKDCPQSNPSCRDSAPGQQTHIFDFHRQTTPAAHPRSNRSETCLRQTGGNRVPRMVNRGVFAWSIHLFRESDSAVTSRAHSLTNAQISPPAIRTPYDNGPAYPPLRADIAADQFDHFAPSRVVCGI